MYALLKVYTLSQLHCAISYINSWKLVKSFSSFVLYILQGCALIGIMFLAPAHRTIACRDMYCVPLMLILYIVCIRCLLIVYFQLALIMRQGG